MLPYLLLCSSKNNDEGLYPLTLPRVEPISFAATNSLLIHTLGSELHQLFLVHFFEMAMHIECTCALWASQQEVAKRHTTLYMSVYVSTKSIQNYTCVGHYSGSPPHSITQHHTANLPSFARRARERAEPKSLCTSARALGTKLHPWGPAERRMPSTSFRTATEKLSELKTRWF